MGLFGKRKQKETETVTKLIDNSVVSLKSKMDVHSDGSISGVPEEFIEEMKKFGYKPDSDTYKELYRMNENVKKATNQDNFMNIDMEETDEPNYGDNRQNYPKPNNAYQVKIPERKSKIQRDRQEQGKPASQAATADATIRGSQRQHDNSNQHAAPANSQNKMGPVIKVPPRRRHSIMPTKEEDVIQCLKNMSNQTTTVDKQYHTKIYINQGASGTVYSATSVVDRSRVALKVMDFKAQPKKNLLLQEIKIMKELKHENLVNFHDCFFEDNNLTIVMELCSGGELTKVCQMIEMPEDSISYITDRSFRGLIYLHSQSIIHRDLKSDNILLNLDGGVKIADFGFCAKLKSDNEKRKTQVGTPYWMAPEIITKSTHNYTVDTWSMGIVIIEMFDANPPYMNLDPMAAMLRIAGSKRMPPIENKAAISPCGMDLLRKMLKYEAEERPMLADLANHAFLRLGDNMQMARFREIVQTALNQP
ncbi:MAG: hypothetical protein MHMPM18_000350 [Marteilia pararefringens]